MTDDREGSYRPSAAERGLASEPARSTRTIIDQLAPVLRRPQTLSEERSPPRPAMARTIDLWVPAVSARWRAGNGWDILGPTEVITGIADLRSRLRAHGLTGSIRRLAICAHSLGGYSLQARAGTVALSPPLLADSLPRSPLIGEIAGLGDFIQPGGMLVLFSCIAAAGHDGNALLIGLSQLLPGRTVVAFITYGVLPSFVAEIAAGNVTDTLRTSHRSEAPGPGFPSMALDRPSAKHARDGAIIRWPIARQLWHDVKQHDTAFAADVEQMTTAANRRRVPLSAPIRALAPVSPLEYYATHFLQIGDGPPP